MIEQGPGLMVFGGIQLLFWLAVATGVALLVVWAVRASARPMSPAGTPPVQGTPRETPLDILARRFASGEITAEEYERGRDLLGGSKL